MPPALPHWVQHRVGVVSVAQQMPLAQGQRADVLRAHQLVRKQAQRRARVAPQGKAQAGLERAGLERVVQVQVAVRRCARACLPGSRQCSTSKRLRCLCLKRPLCRKAGGSL